MRRLAVGHCIGGQYRKPTLGNRARTGVCDLCGNEYDKSFEVINAAGSSRTFDSFECAVEMLAPRCAHCECRIIDHGVEADGSIFCCAHRARQSGVQALQDRVPA